MTFFFVTNRIHFMSLASRGHGSRRLQTRQKIHKRLLTSLVLAFYESMVGVLCSAKAVAGYFFPLLHVGFALPETYWCFNILRLSTKHPDCLQNIQIVFGHVPSRVAPPFHRQDFHNRCGPPEPSASPKKRTGGLPVSQVVVFGTNFEETIELEKPTNRAPEIWVQHRGWCKNKEPYKKLISSWLSWSIEKNAWLFWGPLPLTSLVGLTL